MALSFTRAALAVLVVLALAGPAAASPISVSSVLGGAPASGVVKDNLNWLPIGNAGGTGPYGITVTFGGNAMAVTGSASGLYAAPFLSNLNGVGFGSPDQPAGVDTTVYLTSGSTGASPGARVNIALPGLHQYFGLLWGSVDHYNTLSFYDGATLIGSVVGTQVWAAANGNQGVSGTFYVNINSTVGFDRVVATSSQYAFEFDNLAYGEPVPEPASLLLLGTGLIGLGRFVRRRRS